MRMAYDPAREEVFHIAGDVPADERPVRRAADGLPLPGYGGVTTDYNLQKNAIEVQIRYRDLVLFVDVYTAGEEISIDLVCPRCHNHSWIRSTQKAIEFDPVERLLSIEPFRCSWELGRGTDGTKDDRMWFGLGLCNWTVGVDKNVAKDA